MRRSISLLALAALAGCARCSSTPSPDAGPTPEEPLLPTARLPLPDPWTFTTLTKAPEVSAPAQCTPRGPIVIAKVAKSTRIAAERRSLATLIVGEHADNRLRAAGAMELVPDGKAPRSALVPWLAGGSFPRVARGDRGAWISAVDRPGSAGASRVAVVRGDVAESIGEGDAFEAIDLDCEASRCALLTSRLGKVAPLGATAWLGGAAASPRTWSAIEIVPAGESEARGLSIARPPAADGSAIVAMADKADTALFEVREGHPPREIARLRSPHGVLDAIAIGDPPLALALTFGTPLDDDGCSKDAIEPAVRVERAGKEGASLRVAAPPLGGFLRPLARGAIATYLAPLGCGEPRHVLYAIVLDAEGAPIGTPMAVGDATSYAIATRGADVDLWVQNGSEVTWMRLTCSG